MRWRLAVVLGVVACSENKLAPVNGEVGPSDTSDSGHSADTSDTGDSADTADSGDTADPCADAPPDELACDGQDEDCDGDIDEGTGLDGCIESWPDADLDGVAGPEEAICTCTVPDGYATVRGDCDDADSARILCRSCADILDLGLSSGDGTYDIDPDGLGGFAVACDMTTNGGGYTQLLSLNAWSMTQYDPADILETKATVGILGDSNHASPALYRLAFTEAFVRDTTHATPVHSDTSFAAGTLGTAIDSMLAGTPGADDIWRVGSRSSLQVRSSVTSDGVIAEGDLRVHFIVNADDTADLAFPVSLDYRTDERHLVFDSAAGFAGARIYGDPLYDVASTALDETFTVWAR